TGRYDILNGRWRARSTARLAAAALVSASTILPARVDIPGAFVLRARIVPAGDGDRPDRKLHRLQTGNGAPLRGPNVNGAACERGPGAFRALPRRATRHAEENRATVHLGRTGRSLVVSRQPRRKGAGIRLCGSVSRPGAGDLSHGRHFAAMDL